MIQIVHHFDRRKLSVPVLPLAFCAGLGVAMAVGASTAPASAAGVGAGVPVNRDLFGANDNFANYGNPMGQTRYRNLIKALGVQNMRYISGSPDSFWEWDTGRFVPEAEILAIWPDPWFVNNGANDWVNSQPVGTFNTDSFADFAAAAELNRVQWTANVTTREADAQNMFIHLHNQGDAFDRVEIDNETYFWGNEFAGFNAGGNYVSRFNNASQAIRILDPDAKIGAVFREQEVFTNDSAGTGWNKDWNDQVYAARFSNGVPDPVYDAMILHHYAMEEDRLDGVAPSQLAKTFLAFPQLTMHKAAGVSAAQYGDLPIWITEYNVIAYGHSPATSPNGQWIQATANTAWNALYQASFILTAVNAPDDFTVLNHHSVSNSNGWGLGLTIDNNFARINASGQVFAHLSDVATTSDTMHPVEPDSNPLLGVTVEGESGAKVFQAAGFGSDQELVLVVINRDGGSRDFELANYGWYRNADRVTYHADDSGANGYETVSITGETPVWQQANAPLTPITENASLFPVSGLSLSLPAYSISFITLSDEAPIGDFDNDGTLDIDDLEALISQLDASNPSSPLFDLDGSADGADVDQTDVDEWLSLKGVLRGDANLDNFIDQSDLDAVLQNWGRNDATWGTGDYTGDRFVAQGDLDLVLQQWGGSAAPDLSALDPIPEPVAGFALLAGLLALTHGRRSPIKSMTTDDDLTLHGSCDSCPRTFS